MCSEQFFIITIKNVTNIKILIGLGNCYVIDTALQWMQSRACIILTSAVFSAKRKKLFNLAQAMHF